MVNDIELQEAKDNVFRLMKDKDKIESDLNELKAILDTNNVGMNESLVDSEGYPRQDVDVYQVRHARHKIICLNNDHKDLMKKIEEGLHKIHALTGNRAEDSHPEDSQSDIQEDVQLEPFLRINLVSPGSPAESAGIHVDDLILKFGSISYKNFKSLNDIGALVQNSRYKTVNVMVKRGSNVVSLSLIPHPWSGSGLLGCNAIPIETAER